MTFDEMIAQWVKNGCYNPKMVSSGQRTDLENLRLIELFLNDIENLKTDLFIAKAQYVRNTDLGFSLNRIKREYKATRYAEKWFPFDFLLKDFIYIFYLNDYRLNELSIKIGMLYLSDGFNFKGINEKDGKFQYIKPSDEKIKIEKKILRAKISSTKDVSDLSEECILFLNNMVSTYKSYIKVVKNKKFLNNGFFIKREKYIQYFIELLNKYNGLSCCSINFYFLNDYIGIDYLSIRKKFMNNLRSKNDFKIIVGHVGTWEYSRKYGYYFRVIFFIPRKKMSDLTGFIDEIINYWESFDVTTLDDKNSKITFKAEVGNLSESILILKKSMIVIGSKNRKLIEAFVDGVINYTTLADNYFLPAELQTFLFENLPDEHKYRDNDNYYTIDNLKFSTSRSFRGNLKVF
ncbi:hypothetical protein [Acinetobacter brisouii]|uniref:hypothetical protein n=1 Tax=Acinetobacter brisouii TaxID=396323 RepID=UPI00124DF052|nr:hypothetical protein [Acinetobacter brisouii]